MSSCITRSALSTAVFIQELLSERELTLADCDAVCVSMGPGSYTGLRSGDFKDVAYFEPLYLKEFVATVSKKKMW